ncbi:hypothetical protein Tco_0670611, partial [Tanacetum coccineum]
MFEECDFEDIDDMVNDAMENVEGDTVNAGGAVNTANTGVSVPSASVTTVGVSISTAEPRTPPTTTTTAFEDEDLTIAQTLVKMRTQKDKEKGVAFRDVEESTRSTIILPTINPKDKAQRLFEEEQAQFEREQRIARKRVAEQEVKDAVMIEKMKDIQASMDADVLLAERFQQKEREQFTIQEKSRMLVEMIAKRKRFFATQRAAKQRSKPPTKAQMRNKMCTYLKIKLVQSTNQLKEDSGRKDDRYEYIKQAGSTKKRAGSKLKPKSPKKLKVMKEQESAMDDQEKEELRLCLKIVQDEDRVINYETLAMKSPIIDWESQLLGKFDRQDLFDLHRLVMKRFESVALEGYDLILWGDLKTMIEPNEEDEVWRNQQEWSVIRWKLYECCGVHTLLMDGSLVSINMLVEKKYPLTKEMLTRMLNSRLEADLESTMGLFELIHIHQGFWEPNFSGLTNSEVIVNGDSVSHIASASTGAEGPIPPKTTKQKLERKNELKAKRTLMLAIPNEYLLKFHACK